MPVGMWVIRTAESVVLTDWPPGPEERKTSTRISLSGISMLSVCSISGMTSTAAKRRLAPALVVERADPHQPVGAGLDAERAERVGRLDLEGGRLQPGLLGVGGVHHRGRVAVPLGPAQVHPHQHLGEVRGVDAAGAGADRDDRLALVVLAGEQGAHLELADGLLQRGQLALGLGQRVGVALLLGQLDQDLEVVDPLVHAGDPLELGCWRATGGW